jgi:hypothetical protein
MTASEESSSARKDVLDVLIAYRRAELDGYQRLIERADNRAAGVITVAFGLRGLATASFAALGRALGAVQIGMLALGGSCVMAGVLIAFISRDTRFRKQFLAFRALGSVFRTFLTPFGVLAGTASVVPLASMFAEVVNAEVELSKLSDIEWDEEPSNGVAVRQAIAESLRTRLGASFTVASWSERTSRRAAPLLFVGVLVVGGAFVLTVLAE